MIGWLALHEWRRLRAGLVFWLVLAFGQALIAWLAFAQLEAFATIAPQLQGADPPGPTDLVVMPVVDILVLLVLLAAPLLALGGVAGESRSGRLALWLSAPLGGLSFALARTIGLWLGLLPLLVSAGATLALLGLGVALDWPRVLLSLVGMLGIAFWVAAVCIASSALVGHPVAAMALAHALLLSLRLLDSLPGGSGSHWALMSHVTPLLRGLLRAEDLVYFGVGSAAAVLLAGFLFDRRRGLA